MKYNESSEYPLAGVLFILYAFEVSHEEHTQAVESIYRCTGIYSRNLGSEVKSIQCMAFVFWPATMSQTNMHSAPTGARAHSRHQRNGPNALLTLGNPALL